MTAIDEAAREIAEVRFSCGRAHLVVAGITVAMQGDKCRHGEFPENILPPIPPEELERATVGGKPAKDLPIEMVRWFRGDNWTEEMLKYTAEQINRRHLAPPGERELVLLGSILKEINDRDGCRVLGLVPNGKNHWEVVDVIEPELYNLAGAGIVASGSTPMEAVVKARESLIPSQPAASGGE
jgi:hypothetical protein